MPETKASVVRRIVEGAGVLGLIAVGGWVALAQQGVDKIPDLESAVVDLTTIVGKQISVHEECGQGIRTAEWCHANGFGHPSDMVGPPAPQQEEEDAE